MYEIVEILTEIKVIKEKTVTTVRFKSEYNDSILFGSKYSLVLQGVSIENLPNYWGIDFCIEYNDKEYYTKIKQIAIDEAITYLGMLGVKTKI